MQQVFGRCCQALLAASEVARIRFASFIRGAECTWLRSILPSSAQPAGLVFWYFWDSPCPSALQVPNPPQPQKNSAYSGLIYIMLPIPEQPGGKSSSKERRRFSAGLQLELQRLVELSSDQFRLVKTNTSCLGLAGDWEGCRQLHGLSCFCQHNGMEYQGLWWGTLIPLAAASPALAGSFMTAWVCVAHRSH